MPFARDAKVDPRESPDFELAFADGRTVGLELTELVVTPQAAGGAVARRLCSDLTAALQAEAANVGVILHIPALYVGLSVLTRDRYGRLLSSLTDLVLSRLPGDGEHLHHERELLGAAGIEEVDSVAVFHRAEAAAGSATNGLGSGPGFVQSRIDVKNDLVEGYRTNMGGAEQWLLLVIGFRAASGIWCSIIEERVYASAFDRTFCIDYYDDKAFELTTTPPSRKVAPAEAPDLPADPRPE